MRRNIRKKGHKGSKVRKAGKSKKWRKAERKGTEGVGGGRKDMEGRCVGSKGIKDREENHWKEGHERQEDRKKEERKAGKCKNL
jgi:hypothetical protein